MRQNKNILIVILVIILILIVVGIYFFMQPVSVDQNNQPIETIKNNTIIEERVLDDGEICTNGIDDDLDGEIDEGC